MSTKSEPPKQRRLSRETAAVLCVVAIALACVLIFADGEVKTALLAILTPLGALVAGLAPSLVSEDE
jgi:hypothetical protein